MTWLRYSSVNNQCPEYLEHCFLFKGWVKSLCASIVIVQVGRAVSTLLTCLVFPWKMYFNLRSKPFCP